MANAVKLIAKYMERNAGGRDADTLRDLCLALESGAHFELSRLYELKAKAFGLAMAMIEEWRFDRHVMERRLQKYLVQEAT